MITFQTFASSSSGNAALLAAGDTRLLVDMGVSCRRLCQALSDRDLTAGDLTAVVVTHEHTDHVSGLAAYIKKYATPILCTPGTAWQLQRRLPAIGALLRPAELGKAVRVGEAAVTLLPTSHDCAQGAAVHVAAAGGSVGLLTDTGYILEETGRRLLGVDLLVLESNHQEELVLAGPYPYGLKRRVLGPKGHLSNGDAARYAAASARAGTGTILLAHLSQENNTPQLALETVGGALEAAGWTGRLAVAPGGEAGELYTLERTVCGE